MPDLSSLSIDQRSALRLAAATLHDEFSDAFSTETIQLYLETSYDQFASRAKFTHFLPLLAERFARQRLRALARDEGLSTDNTPKAAVPIRQPNESELTLLITGWLCRTCLENQMPPAMIHPRRQ